MDLKNIFLDILSLFSKKINDIYDCGKLSANRIVIFKWSIIILVISLSFLAFETENLKIISKTFVLYDRMRGSESMLNII